MLSLSSFLFTFWLFWDSFYSFFWKEYWAYLLHACKTSELDLLNAKLMFNIFSCTTLVVRYRSPHKNVCIFSETIQVQQEEEKKQFFFNIWRNCVLLIGWLVFKSWNLFDLYFSQIRYFSLLGMLLIHPLVSLSCTISISGK